MEQKLKERPSEMESLTWGSIPYAATKPRVTIADNKKCLLIREQYSCPLREFARAGPIQMMMYTGKHQTQHPDPNGDDWAKNVDAEGICNSIGRTTISTYLTSQSS